MSNQVCVTHAHWLHIQWMEYGTKLKDNVSRSVLLTPNNDLPWSGEHTFIVLFLSSNLATLSSGSTMCMLGWLEQNVCGTLFVTECMRNHKIHTLTWNRSYSAWAFLSPAFALAMISLTLCTTISKGICSSIGLDRSSSTMSKPEDLVESTSQDPLFSWSPL